MRDARQRSGWSALPLLAACLLYVETVLASWYGPEPFRRERVDGQEIRYETESFMNRFSFDPMPALHENVLRPRDGVFGTGGSTRSNELYVRQHVQLSLPTDTLAYVGYRFFRSEDFDGRFDEQLLGIGTRSEAWQLVFWGDVEGDKSETDLQFEAQWFGADSRYLRVIVAAPDALFNQKTESNDEYSQSPYTLYVSGWWPFADQHSLYGFANWNNPTRFFDDDLNVKVEDHAISAGIGVQWADALGTTGLELEGLHGARDRHAGEQSGATEQSLQRRFWQLTLERRSLARDKWMGARLLRYHEDDERPSDAPNSLDQLRRENYLYGGQQWRMRDGLWFSPTLMLGYVDINERYRLQPDKTREVSGVIGKLLPAFVFSLRSDPSATISVVPTLYLHRAAFGGGNVQLHVPL